MAAVLRAPGSRVSRFGADDVVATEHRFEVDPAGGEVELIVTGVRRGGLPGNVVVSLEPSPPPADSGGCATGTPDRAPLLLIVAAVLSLRACGRRRASAAGR